MIGKSIAHYQVLEKLGQGGMGDVYRAEDTKLDRAVALKLLPSDFATDPERLARFRREAKVLASLNHPNIAAIHGLEEADGLVFLVMELAAGEDLAKRITRGPLSVDDVVDVARQMAEGLEQAHERGVVHRDLKPANVMLSDDGVVKILDFGLARAYAGESAAEGQLENSPTITAAMTAVGTILGTAAYMSPEQARGREVDRRADIWAFGVILYELLVGKRLFEGETISDTLAGVLKTEPDLDSLPEKTPVALRWLIERCLQKHPSSRLRDIGEARILLQSDLQQIPASSIGMTAVVETGRVRRLVPVFVVLALLSAVLGGWGGRTWFGGSEPEARLIRALMPAPAGQSFVMDSGAHMAISPDGSQIVFAAMDSAGGRSLWVRRLDRAAAFQLTGTEWASYPFWSPDASKIGFFASGSMRKIDAAGGVATSVCPAPSGRGGNWLEDGRILFAPTRESGISIVSSSGGAPRQLTATDSVYDSHRWPQILPDQEHYLYTKLGIRTGTHLIWSSLSGNEQDRELLTGVYGASFHDGSLLFVRDDALWGRPFDPDRGEFLGEEALIVDSVDASVNWGGAAYAASDGGTLVYSGKFRTSDFEIGIYDWDARPIGGFAVPGRNLQDPALSPDGRFMAFGLEPVTAEEMDIWIQDVERGTLSRFTEGGTSDDPAWSPDGTQLVYCSPAEVVIRSAEGGRSVVRKWENAGLDFVANDWSPDGRFIVGSREGVSGGGRSLWVYPVAEGEEPFALFESDATQVHADFSPDGKWIAYTSLETGTAQVFVRSLEPGGGFWQVSTEVGVQPRWSADGGRLYFLGENRRMHWVNVEETARGLRFGRVERGELFPIVRQRGSTSYWGVMPDGDAIWCLISGSSGLGSQPTAELIVGWKEILAAR